MANAENEEEIRGAKDKQLLTFNLQLSTANK